MNTLLDMTTDLGVWLASGLSDVSDIMSEHLHSSHSAVNKICGELAVYRGKLLRPSLLLLSWRSSCPDEEELRSDVLRASAVVELIHLATLVHDDVLDEANLRRGEKTIGCLHGNETAVMLGDYLLSSAFHLCSTIGNPDLNLLFGEVTNMVCAGEMVQLYHRNDVDLDVDSYYQIIHDKTASLISASCAVGGILGGADDRVVDALRKFGESIGVAFQIRDDLLDLLGERRTIGKPTGVDLEKGKLTLPVILMLRERPDLKSDVRDAIKNKNESGLRKLLYSANAIQSAFDEVERLVDDAVAVMHNELNTDASIMLCELAQQLKQPL